MTPEESNLVEPEDACPLCSERRADCLEWDEDREQVTCSMCGCTYTPKANQGD